MFSVVRQTFHLNATLLLVVLPTLAFGPACKSEPPLPEGPVLLYARHYLRPIYMEDRPHADEVGRTVALAAAPGETEPASVGVFARVPVTGGKLLPTALTGPAGAEIPPAAFDVRVTRYIEPRRRWPELRNHPLHPGFLDKVDTFDVPAGQSRQVWVTLEVPPDAAPGLYRGELRFTAVSGPSASLPLEVRVHPFTLDPPRQTLFLHGDNFPLEDASLALSRRYGMNTINVNHGWAKQVVPVYEGGTFSFPKGFAPVERAIERAHEHGLGIDHPIGIGFYSHLTQSVPFALQRAGLEIPIEGSADRLRIHNGYEVFFERGSAVEEGERLPGPYYPVSNPAAHPTTEYGRALFEGWVTSLETMDRIGRERGWPPLFYYLVDEPHHNRGLMRMAIQMARAADTAGADGMITCNEPTMSEPDEDELWYGPLAGEPALRLEPWVKTRCYHNKYVGPETLERTRQAGDRYGTYVNIYGNRPASVRYQGGFLIWRAELDLVMFWNFKHAVQQAGEGGDLSVLRDLEAAREGIDDLRYVATLERLVRDGAGTDEGRARAGALLDELRSTLEPTARGIGYVDGVSGRWVPGDDAWEPERFDELRARIAGAITSLVQPAGRSAGRHSAGDDLAEHVLHEEEHQVADRRGGDRAHDPARPYLAEHPVADAAPPAQQPDADDPADHGLGTRHGHQRQVRQAQARQHPGKAG